MKKFSAFVWGWGTYFLHGESVFAQSSKFGIIPSPGEGRAGELGKRIANGDITLQDISLVIIYLIDLVTKLAGTVAVIFILYAGFQLISSGLDEGAREEAKNTLQYAAIGLVVCLLAWVIVNVIQVQLTA